MRAFSSANDGLILLILRVYLSHCVMVNIYREYRAVIILIAIKIMVMFDHEIICNITTNNSDRLVVGGRAKFVRLANSHHVEINGRNVCKSQARIIVWLWILS